MSPARPPAAARLPLRTARAAERSPVELVAARKPADREVADIPVVPAAVCKPVVPAAARKPAAPPPSRRNSAAVAPLPSGSAGGCWPERKTATKKNTRQETGRSQQTSRGALA